MKPTRILNVFLKACTTH